MQKSIVFFFIGILYPILSFSQNTEREVYSFVEEMPKPTYNISKFLADHLSYPTEAKNQNIQGKVYVQFIVDTSGNITHPKIVKSPSQLLDSESISVIGQFPKFKPGKQNGKTVNVYYTIPITFKL